MVTLTVEVDAESLEDLDIVHCPVCTSIDPFSADEYEYQCQACGAIFVLVRGRQDFPTDDQLEHKDVRIAFLDHLEMYPETWSSLGLLAATVNGVDYTLGKLLKELEACEDPLPGDWHDEIDLPAGSTYADAVRKIRKELEIR